MHTRPLRRRHCNLVGAASLSLISVHSGQLSVGLRGSLLARMTANASPECEMKTTAYFDVIRKRPDRAIIRNEWIERVVRSPHREAVQSDGRIRRWAPIPEMDNRHLRVILLSDGETVHNAFFDRRFAS